MFNIYLNKNVVKEYKSSSPFIYNNEVNSFAGEIKSGSIAKVYTYDHNFVGLGFFNADSKIMVRLLTDKDIVINRSFWLERLALAISHRENLNLTASNALRLVFGEADLLPGLVVDKYADILVCQFTSLGMYNLREEICSCLVELLHPQGIYYRNDTSVNAKEGIPLTKGFLYNEFPTQVLVEENGLKFYVDVENGQKTGYFLDQKFNRDNLKYYVKGKVVLDCFSHTGGFALNAAKNGAKEVMAVDISELAVNTILANAKLNDFTNIKACCCDVFDYLREEEIKDKYDVIVLDPPAFTKAKETVKKAYKGYKDINLQALKALKKGGYLVTFSCSQHMTLDLFLAMLKDAVSDSKRICQMVDFRIQAPDHPTLLNGLELYLKCVILRVLD